MSPNKLKVSYTFSAELVQKILAEADKKRKPVSQIVEDILENHYNKPVESPVGRLLRRLNEPTVASQVSPQ
jgi:hypothetical protein